jgi:raffinose/stachyose/melibiose transport system substrate-binding protein
MTRKSLVKLKKILPALALASALLATTSCTGGSPGTSASDVPQQTSGPEQIRYMIGQPEDPGDLDLTKADIKTFESQNPGITVKLDVVPSDNVRTVLQTQLRSGQGPDVFGYDTGPGFAGALEKAGLLYDLTGAYAKNGWPIYDFAKQRVTFDGKVVGIPSDIEELGIFYNKDLFAKLGIAQPHSLDDLRAAARTVADAKLVPLAVSDKEGWQGGHLLSMALSSQIGSQGMSDLLSGKTSWDSPAVISSLSVWDDLAKAGDLTSSPVAVTYDSANALFYSGKAAMNPTGSWLTQDLQRNAKFGVGFIPFPAQAGPGIFSGGLGSGTFVSASTKHAEASTKFLNYLVSPAHGRWQVENYHTIPAFPVDTSGVKASPLFAQILGDASKIAAGSGDFGYNIDVLTTDTFNNAMWNGMQGILTGQTSPNAVAKNLQRTFATTAKK